MSKRKTVDVYFVGYVKFDSEYKPITTGNIISYRTMEEANKALLYWNKYASRDNANVAFHVDFKRVNKNIESHFFKEINNDQLHRIFN